MAIVHVVFLRFVALERIEAAVVVLAAARERHGTIVESGMMFFLFHVMFAFEIVVAGCAMAHRIVFVVLAELLVSTLESLRPIVNVDLCDDFGTGLNTTANAMLAVW